MLKPDNLPVTFGKNDVEIIARETLYRGFFSLDLYRFRHRLFNGQMSHEVRREIFERGHAAVLLPFDPVRVHVVSREQAYQWVEEGKIDNAASVIALQWLQLHHQALKNEWA